jgi:hypothetical protein
VQEVRAIMCRSRTVRSNSALVNDACGRRCRAFFSASQRER